MLGIFGDSYADVNNSFQKPSINGYAPWPKTLASLLNTSANYYAKSSTSIWWSYKKFLETYKNYDTIVFTYSQHNRWWYINDVRYENLHHVTTEEHLNIYKSNHDLYKIASMLVECKKITYSDEFDIFVYQSIFDSINDLCKQNNIKLVNFLPFEGSEFNEKLFVDISKRSGACITNAIDVSINEISKKYARHFTRIVNTGDPRYCHLNPNNNNVIAKLITEVLDTPDLVVPLNLDSRISTEIEEVEWMLR